MTRQSRISASDGTWKGHSYGDANFDLTATATSDLDVTYSSSDLTVATIIGSTVTVVGPGTTTITAMQDGDDMYLDLNKAPHLLIAGATGSGKSVCLNSILLSLLGPNSMLPDSAFDFSV